MMRSERNSVLAENKISLSHDRYVKSKSYLIFYRYENNQIFVDRIIHGKRDYISILFPYEENEEEN